MALIQSFSHYNIVGQKLVNIVDLCGAEYVGHASVSRAKAGLPWLGCRELSKGGTEEIMEF